MAIGRDMQRSQCRWDENKPALPIDQFASGRFLLSILPNKYWVHVGTSVAAHPLKVDSRHQNMGEAQASCNECVSGALQIRFNHQETVVRKRVYGYARRRVILASEVREAVSYARSAQISSLRPTNCRHPRKAPTGRPVSHTAGDEPS